MRSTYVCVVAYSCMLMATALKLQRPTNSKSLSKSITDEQRIVAESMWAGSAANTTEPGGKSLATKSSEATTTTDMQAMMAESIWPSFEQFLLSRAQKGTVILVFGNNGYRSTIVNWMAGVHKLSVSNFALVCTDDELGAFMSTTGMPCYEHEVMKSFLRLSPDLDLLWNLRLHLLSRALDAGINVIMSDGDAFWQRNPIELLSQHDITASPSRFPPESYKKYGVSMCMGLIYFRGTPEVAKFIRDEVVDKDTDDQAAINRALVRLNAQFGTNKQIHYKSKNSTQVHVGTVGNIRISMLDHSRFVRHCDPVQYKNAYVVHCNSDKSGESKEKSMKSHRTWMLKDQWETVQPTGDFGQWMEDISVN